MQEVAEFAGIAIPIIRNMLALTSWSSHLSERVFAL
jgi:hypothetical protein